MAKESNSDRKTVDGFGDANSYQRYGFNWDKIASNIYIL